VAWKYHPWFYCLIWFCYFLVGIVQWFLIIPWMASRATVSRPETR
jgi:hypothetical protein